MHRLNLEQARRIAVRAQLLDAHSEPPTPLQRRLAVLGRQIAAAAAGLCLLVLVLGLLRGEDLEPMLLTSVSLAVAAVPESATGRFLAGLVEPKQPRARAPRRNRVPAAA